MLGSTEVQSSGTKRRYAKSEHVEHRAIVTSGPLDRGDVGSLTKPRCRVIFAANCRSGSSLGSAGGRPSRTAAMCSLSTLEPLQHIGSGLGP